MKSTETLYRWFTRFSKRLSERQLILILAVLVGIAAGIAGHLLRGCIHLIKQGLTSWADIEVANLLYFLYPMIGIAVTVLFVKYWVKDDISHGVTRIFYAISRRESRIKPHNCYTSLLASSATIGFGGSVGAEAPIVLTGAAIGSTVGQLLRLNYKYITLLLGCGAGAAIAAVYKAPIAGFVFVIEVLMLELTFTSVVPLILASVTAATTTYLLVDMQPFFAGVAPTFTLKEIPFYALLGIVGGCVSYFFASASMRIEGRIKAIGKQRSRVLIGGLVLGALIFVFPPLYGEGYETITQLMTGQQASIFDQSLFYEWRDAFWMIVLYVAGILVFKVAAMTLTNASGGVGGTFAPSLFVGAMQGYLFAIVCNRLFGTELPVAGFTLVGMATVMGGVMKAPITSMFLVAELTGGFVLFLPLMLASAVSFAVSYYFEPYSIYTKRLAARGELLTRNKDENTMQFLHTRSLIEYDFETVPLNGKLRHVIRAVEHTRRNIFPVVSLRGELMGVITMDDIRADMFDADKYADPLTRYMSQPPERIHPDEPIRSVMEKFEQTQVWNLPVVDETGHYLGFLSKSKLLTAYREQLAHMSDE
ncbi:chloride channel protein [uncultured Rikenella sp.]|uniref:chloride channel protein n=1 Tax=uncultured Rikenella sp. TaxID=368003 RepID=UPI00272B5944|nr:chloride channel protein [uncultured Rikenella sp.]